MPTFSNCKIYIRGDQSMIDQVVGEKFSLANTVPSPRGLLQLDSFDFDSWFVKNWGVKWDAQNARISIKNGRIKVSFETPYQPPLMWLLKTSILLPELNFEMFWFDDEYPGCGKVEAQNGQVNGFKFENGEGGDAFMKENYENIWEGYHENDESDEDSEEEKELDENDGKIIVNNEFIYGYQKQGSGLAKMFRFYSVIKDNKLDELSKDDALFFVDLILKHNNIECKIVT